MKRWPVDETASTRQGFKYEFSFLHNSYRRGVWFRGIEFCCAGTAFWATRCPEKWSDKVWREIFPTLSPRDAKSDAMQSPLPEGWKENRLALMKEVLVAKFVNDDIMRYHLLQTEGILLVNEEREYGSDYWGTVDYVGDNHLGEIVMEIRKELLDGVYDKTQ